MPQTWTSVGQAAELLHCDRELILRWIAAGDLVSRGGAEVCLQIEAAPSITDLATIASNDAGRESALGLALAKLAQDDAARARRAYSRTRALAASLAVVLFAVAAAGGYEIARARVAAEVTAGALIDAQRANTQLTAERDEVRDQVARASADAAELRGRLAAMEQLREAEANRPRRTGTAIDTLVAMLQ